MKEFIRDRQSLEGCYLNPAIVSLRPVTNQYGGSTNHMLFHFACWLRGVECSQFKIGFEASLQGDFMMPDIGSNDLMVIFANHQEGLDFTKWLAEKETWYPAGMLNSSLPTMPTSGSHAIHIVEFGTRRDAEDELFETWSWIINNSEKPVWWTFGLYAFTEAKDAVRFKLEWVD